MFVRDITLGIDFGNTIVHNDSNGNKVAYPKAIEVIAEACRKCKNVYIISKVNEAQRLRVLSYLKESGFHEKTGMPPTNVFFCGARDQKGLIARKLRINCFIDDRPEVMAHMDKTVYKILFCPNRKDVERFELKHLQDAYSWDTISEILFEGNE
jgi:hypothetical protein